MKVNALFLAVLAVLTGCTLPLGSPGPASLSIVFSVPSAQSRMIAQETAQFRVAVSAAGDPEVVSYFVPVVVTEAGVRKASLTVAAKVGPTTVFVQSLDAGGKVLTQGSTTVTVVKGPNVAAVSLLPPLLLSVGDTQGLDASQVAYFTIPFSSGQVLLSGTGSRFWAVSSTGTFSGPGTLGTFLVDPVVGQDTHVRVEQTTAGSFSVGGPLVDLFLQQSYNVSVGVSRTFGPSATQMQIAWDNPSSDNVKLFRASAFAGPYTEVYSGSGSSFLDTDSSGLVPGTTYYYAIALGGSTMPGTGPVAGVVSGTTLAWDASLGKGVPVIGTAYLVPSVAMVDGLAGKTWDNTELANAAILAGGYTWWAWGSPTDNDVLTVIAAFDSHGTYQNHHTLARRYLTSLQRVGDSIQIAGQLNGGTDDGVDEVPWVMLDWFTQVNFVVEITVTVPEKPVVGVWGSGPRIDKAYLETLAVNTTGLADPPWFLEWQIDGLTSYLDSTPFNVDGYDLYVDSAYLELGTHEVVLYYTDGVKVYSSTFYFEVVETAGLK